MALANPILDKLLLEPNLLYPGVKPVGQVEQSESSSLSDGLIFHLPKFNADLQDTSGRNNNATVVGSPSVVIDPTHGQVLELNGANDYVDLGSTKRFLSTTQPFTFVWWEYVGTSPSAFPGVATFMPSDGSYRFLLLRSSNSGYDTLTAGLGDGAASPVTFSTAPSLASSVGVWRQWILEGRGGVGSSTQADWDVYVNLVKHGADGNTTLSPQTTSYNLIGWDGADNKWKSRIDAPRLYNRILNDSEKRELYFNRFGDLTSVGSVTLPIPVAVGGFQAAWAVNSNVLINGSM